MSKYIIRDGIPVKIEDAIVIPGISRYMSDLDRYANKYEYSMSDILNAINSKMKNGMVIGDAVEEVKENMVVGAKNLADSKPISNTIKDELSSEDLEEFNLMSKLADAQTRIRAQITKEYDAIDGYKTDANLFLEWYRDTGDEVYKQLAQVFLDIRKEEIPHTGELNKCLSLIDEEEGKLFNKGVREAKKEIANTETVEQTEEIK